MEEGAEETAPLSARAPLVAVTGRLQSESGVIHVVAEEVKVDTHFTGRLGLAARDINTLARAEDVRCPTEDARDKRVKLGKRLALTALLTEEPALEADIRAVGARSEPAAVLPKGRNFH